MTAVRIVARTDSLTSITIVGVPVVDAVDAQAEGRPASRLTARALRPASASTSSRCGTARNRSAQRVGLGSDHLRHILDEHDRHARIVEAQKLRGHVLRQIRAARHDQRVVGLFPAAEGDT